MRSTIHPSRPDSFHCTDCDARNSYLYDAGWTGRNLGKGCPVTFRSMVVSAGLLAAVCLSGCACAQQSCCESEPVCAYETESSGWVSAPSPNGLIEQAIPVVPSEPSDPPPAPGVVPSPAPAAVQPKLLPAPAAEPKVEREANARPAPSLFITP